MSARGGGDAHRLDTECPSEDFLVTSALALVRIAGWAGTFCDDISLGQKFENQGSYPGQWIIVHLSVFIFRLLFL